MSRSNVLCFVLMYSLGHTAPLRAQPVPSREPSSTHIFPAGGQRGTTVHVLVGGECIPPETGFRITGAGVLAPPLLVTKAHSRTEPSPRREPREIPISYPKEWESTIDIEPDAPLGPCMWRLTCARGGSGSRPFIIGDLTEFMESDSNSVPSRADRVQLPVTVNGRIAGESDLDYFVFAAQGGDVVLCDVLAGRIGSPLDPVVEITNAAGQRLRVDELRLGSDPVIAFRVPVSGDYRLLISNVSFHGGPAHVYRITLRTIADLPDAASSGILAELIDRELIPSVSAATVGEHGTRSDFALPRAADLCRNTSPSSAIPLELPATFRGRLDASSNAGWFRFRAEKDQAITMRCCPRPSGLAMLPMLAVLDTDGKLLAECKSTESAERECWLDWRAPADGEFRIRLGDARNSPHGAAESGFELTVQPAQPEFALRFTAVCANVTQGAKTELEVKARRSGGFSGPIDIVTDGLPTGVRAAPVQLAANQDTAKILLVAEDETRPTDTLMRVIGRAAIGDTCVERVATAPHLGHDVDGTTIGSKELDRLNLTVQHKPVFRLYCNEAYQYAHRGTIYPYAMQVERLGDFNGEVTIQLGDRQNRDLDGVQFIEVRVTPGVTEAKVPIYLPESMHINVLSQSQIYAQGYALFSDKWGQRQATLVVSEKRNMIRTLPTIVKLSAAEKDLSARPGANVLCKLVIDRTSNFTGAMEVELLATEPGGFLADPVRIEPSGEAAELAVRVPAQVDRGETALLRFRARGELSPEVTVISETAIPLRIE